MEHENSTSYCVNMFSKRFQMSGIQRYILVTYTVSVNGVLNVLLNGLVICLLLKMKQINIPSMRMMLYMNISNVSISLLVVTNVLLLTVFSDKRNCAVEALSQFIANLVGHTSPFLLLLMSFDRYASIKFLTKYKVVMSKERTDKMVVFVFSLALLESLLYAFGTFLNVHRLMSYIVISIDFLLTLSCAIVLPVMTVKAIRSHRKKSANQEMLSEVQRSVISITKKYLYGMIFLYGLYFIAIILHVAMYAKSSSYGKGRLEFMFFLGVFTGLTNSVVNALIFIKFNKKARCLFKKMVKGSMV